MIKVQPWRPRGTTTTDEGDRCPKLKQAIIVCGWTSWTNLLQVIPPTQTPIEHPTLREYLHCALAQKAHYHNKLLCAEHSFLSHCQSLGTVPKGMQLERKVSLIQLDNPSDTPSQIDDILCKVELEIQQTLNAEQALSGPDVRSSKIKPDDHKKQIQHTLARPGTIASERKVGKQSIRKAETAEDSPRSPEILLRWTRDKQIKELFTSEPLLRRETTNTQQETRIP